MPTLRSSYKRLRQNRKARIRNRAARSLLRTSIKKAQAATGREEALALLPGAMSVIDRSVKKGVIHRNMAARYKSRLTRRVGALET
ncbi:MAG: 30S ribosomal protein S20 [Candidatus Latescibacteria bacterium]|nr:30S ribosomal protein S20 [Candidatus Latescibacterota bacterium]